MDLTRDNSPNRENVASSSFLPPSLSLSLSDVVSLCSTGRDEMEKYGEEDR